MSGDSCSRSLPFDDFEGVGDKPSPESAFDRGGRGSADPVSLSDVRDRFFRNRTILAAVKFGVDG